MLSHFSQLSEHVLQKSEDQIRLVQELSLTKNNLEQRLMEAGSVHQSLGHEIQNHQVRISHLEADCKQFEKTANERLEEIRTADLTIKNYKELNDDLCMKIEKHERTAKVEVKKEQEEESSVVQELSDKINYLNDVIAQSEKQMAEKEK